LAILSVACGSKLFPISSGSESVEIKEGMAVQYGVRDANDSLKSEQRFFVELVSTEQIGVIAEISEEPAELAQRQRRSINKQIEFLLDRAIRQETGDDVGTSTKRAKRD
jgi:hypothetical protein